MEPRTIYWITSPLNLYTGTGVSRTSGGWPNRLPSVGHGHLSRLQHWTIAVGKYCYEISAFDGRPGKANLDVNVVPSRDWFAVRRRAGIYFDVFKLGQTLMSDRNLRYEGGL